MKKKNLTNGSSLTLTDGISNKKLKEKKYLVSVYNCLKSVDVGLAQYRSYVDEDIDKDIIFDIKRIKEFIGKSVPLGELPITPPDDERDYFLLNNPSDIGRTIRYQAIQEEIGFTEDLLKVSKYEFDHYDFHRIFVYKNDDPEKREFKILFSDPFHHVAIGSESKANLYWTYEKCQSKTYCISEIFNED